MPAEISSLSDDEAMQLLGKYIDQAMDLGDAEMASSALNLCDEMGSRINGATEVELCYFRANAWSAIRYAKHKDAAVVWLWDQEEILHEIYWLRYAVRNDSF